MVSILLNSVILGAYDYSDREDLYMRNKVLNVIGEGFSIAFIVEAILKIIS